LISPHTSASETQPARELTSLEILERLLEANRESVIVVDGTRRVIAANRAAEIAFGRQYGSMRSRLLSEVIRDLQLHEAFSRAIDERASTEVKMDFIGTGKRSYDIHVSPIDLDGSAHAIGHR
jgi:transcriptional regulator of aromatic amino acid metabolism